MREETSQFKSQRGRRLSEAALDGAVRAGLAWWLWHLDVVSVKPRSMARCERPRSKELIETAKVSVKPRSMARCEVEFFGDLSAPILVSVKPRSMARCETAVSEGVTHGNLVSVKPRSMARCESAVKFLLNLSRSSQ